MTGKWGRGAEREGREIIEGAYPSWPYEEGLVELKEALHPESTEVVLHLDNHLHTGGYVRKQPMMHQRN